MPLAPADLAKVARRKLGLEATCAEDTAVVEAAFALCHADRDGEIDGRELVARYGKPAEHMLEEFDLDVGGTISAAGFLAAVDAAYERDALRAAKWLKHLADPPATQQVTLTLTRGAKHVAEDVADWRDAEMRTNELGLALAFHGTKAACCSGDAAIACRCDGCRRPALQPVAPQPSGTSRGGDLVGFGSSNPTHRGTQSPQVPWSKQELAPRDRVVWLGLGRIVASYDLLILFTPYSRTYSLPLFLKRRCDRTLGLAQGARRPAIPRAARSQRHAGGAARGGAEVRPDGTL
jgi:hypothetical protein